MAIESKVIQQIAGKGIPVRGDDIDTDRIIPARFLKCVTFDGLGEHAFQDERIDSEGNSKSHPLDDPRFQEAQLLIVNRNFGCGSSREHAPQALMRWGIRGVIGESFAEIFSGNCTAMGVPCVRASSQDVRSLMESVEEVPGQEIALDVDSQVVRYSGGEIPIQIPPAVRDQFLQGNWDTAAQLLSVPREVDRVAQSLPYVAGWD